MSFTQLSSRPPDACSTVMLRGDSLKTVMIRISRVPRIEGWFGKSRTRSLRILNSHIGKRKARDLVDDKVVADRVDDDGDPDAEDDEENHHLQHLSSHPVPQPQGNRLITDTPWHCDPLLLSHTVTPSHARRDAMEACNKVSAEER
eukprot:460417-Rhodomonas_salina.2